MGSRAALTSLTDSNRIAACTETRPRLKSEESGSTFCQPRTRSNCARAARTLPSMSGTLSTIFRKAVPQNASVSKSWSSYVYLYSVTSS